MIKELLNQWLSLTKSMAKLFVKSVTKNKNIW